MKRQTRRIALLAMAVMAVATIIGCATGRDVPVANLHPHDITEVRPIARPPGHRPVVALVLGGGGLRGFAHIGVLHALEERGIHRYRGLDDLPGLAPLKAIDDQWPGLAASLSRRTPRSGHPLSEYIDGFYNPTRRHSYLGSVSPVELEAAHRTRRSAAH